MTGEGYMHVGLFGLLVCLSLFLYYPNRVFANEGRISLSRNGANCEALSILRGGRYSVFGRCHGFVYPYTAGYPTYVLWGDALDGDRGVVRISEIDEGYIDGDTDVPFSRVFITAEKEIFPGDPEGYRVLEGEVADFAFTSPVGNDLQETYSPPVLTPIAVEQAESTPASRFSIGNVFGTVSLVVFAVLAVIIIGVLALIWRASAR